MQKAPTIRHKNKIISLAARNCKGVKFTELYKERNIKLPTTAGVRVDAIDLVFAFVDRVIGKVNFQRKLSENPSKYR